MKKVERYFYPAIFTYENGEEISVVFPDLDCATSGINDDDALLSARELLGIVLFGMEEDKEEIPAPTPLSQIRTEENERAVLIDVYMPSIRMAQVNKSVNRTVTLPAWLNSAALEKILIFHKFFKTLLKHSFISIKKGGRSSLLLFVTIHQFLIIIFSK